MVQRLVEAGAQINMEGWTPLIYAAFNGHLPVVQFLMSKGADINAVSENGMTAAMAAARGGFMDILALLVQAGADLNKQTASGESALDWAIKTRNTDAADYLKAHGALPGKAVKIQIQ